jgi:hypothetical protein
MLTGFLQLQKFQQIFIALIIFFCGGILVNEHILYKDFLNGSVLCGILNKVQYFGNSLCEQACV